MIDHKRVLKETQLERGSKPREDPHVKGGGV